MDVTTRPRLLGALDEIDANWLDAVLAAAGHDAHVTEFALEPIGAGNVSDTARIVLTAEGDAPASIVAKFRPRDEGSHAHGIGSGAYVREAGAYRLFAERGGCRTPRLLWLDGTDDNINLMMEDLSGTTRAGDQIAGCSIADAREVTRALARLHRTYWPMRDADAPDWAIRMPEVGDYWVPVMARAVPIVAARFAGQLPDRHIALVAAAAEVSRTWHDLPHAAMTITHGDPRVDNILFDERSGEDPEAVLIDWQVTGVRNPMHDLGYFLSGSIAIDDRRAAERDLLALYAGEFAHDDYPPDAIERDYRIQLVSGLMTTAAAIALLPDVPAVNRLILTLLERNCAAVEDWSSVDALEQLKGR